MTDSDLEKKYKNKLFYQNKSQFPVNDAVFVQV